MNNDGVHLHRNVVFPFFIFQIFFFLSGSLYLQACAMGNELTRISVLSLEPMCSDDVLVIRVIIVEKRFGNKSCA